MPWCNQTMASYSFIFCFFTWSRGILQSSCLQYEGLLLVTNPASNPKPPRHHENHRFTIKHYEWNDLWPSKSETWNLPFLDKFPHSKSGHGKCLCEVWEANKVKWHLFPPSPSTWSLTAPQKKNIQNVPTHAWFWGCRIWGLRMGNSGLSWQVRI